MSLEEQKAHPLHFYDVIIAGAGPAGTSCALTLKNSGLKIALLDKANFPRNKVCGDAISTKAVKVLKKMNPDYAEAFSAFESKTEIASTRFVASFGKEFTIFWKSKAYNCNRTDFDNFLLELLKKENCTSIHLNTEIKSVHTSKEFVEVHTSQGLFKTSVLIGCDGSQSQIAKKLAGFSINKKHYCGAVRGYFETAPSEKTQINEVFFLKKYLPGYLWVFPVSPTTYNVGFGMLSEDISKKNINLSKAFTEIIEEIPELRNRFSNAVMKEKLEGFGLALGTRKLALSGHRFLLCGDAASLIDPNSGDGIANAMISGQLAALHVLKHKKDKIFTKKTNEEYEASVYSLLWKDLKMKALILRIISRFPFLIELGFILLSGRHPISKFLKKRI